MPLTARECASCLGAKLAQNGGAGCNRVLALRGRFRLQKVKSASTHTVQRHECEWKALKSHPELASDPPAAYPWSMMYPGWQRFVLYFSMAGLAFGGCGKEHGGNTQQTGGAGMSLSTGSTPGSSGASSALLGGNGVLGGLGGSGSLVGLGGIRTAGAGGQLVLGVGGSPIGGAAGGGNRAGAGGASAQGGQASYGGSVMVGGAPTAADCEPGAGFVGQLTGPGSIAPNGGIFTTNASNVAYGDANLDAILASYPLNDQVQAIDVNVQGAIVTATAGATAGPGVSASRTTFWIADDHAMLKVALDPAAGPSCCPDFEVRTGMRISFRATEVSTFIRLGEITAASSFVSGSQGNCVLVREPAKITDINFYQMVRVSAQLGDSVAATDGQTYWALGRSDVILYDFLSPNPSLQKGQSITFVGPVSSRVGYHMLVEYNQDWVKVEN
ncbi:MAG: hypothetical protein SFV15_07205 [Polyangiaceae bacterium]|nr:hypothetical protein [Polyangiaceae bacterium]